MTPKERLLEQEPLVDLMIKHQYIPQASQQNFNLMLAALREVNPGAIYDPGCSGCMMEIAISAKRIIEGIKKEKDQALRFMTFPNQEPAQEPVKKKRGRPFKNKDEHSIGTPAKGE